jgi:hypothetical protein
MAARLSQASASLEFSKALSTHCSLSKPQGADREQCRELNDNKRYLGHGVGALAGDDGRVL